MINYENADYSSLMGKIADVDLNAVACMSQCTGCKCSCKCSCSSVETADLDWEEL